MGMSKRKKPLATPIPASDFDGEPLPDRGQEPFDFKAMVRKMETPANPIPDIPAIKDDKVIWELACRAYLRTD
jgi:hypothetical protein